MSKEKIREDDVINLSIGILVSTDDINHLLFGIEDDNIYTIEGYEVEIYEEEECPIIGKRRYQVTGDDEVDLLLKLKVHIYEKNPINLFEKMNIFIPIEVKAPDGDMKKGIGQAKLLQELFGISYLLVPSNMRSYIIRRDKFKAILTRENIGLLILDLEQRSIYPEIVPRLTIDIFNKIKRKSLYFEFYDRFISLAQILKSREDLFENLVINLKKRGYVIERNKVREILGGKYEKLFFSTFCLTNINLNKLKLLRGIKRVIDKNLNLKISLTRFLSLDSSFINELFSYSVHETRGGHRRIRMIARILDLEESQFENYLRELSNYLIDYYY